MRPRPRRADQEAILDVRPLEVDYRPHPAQLAFHHDRGRVAERYLCAGTRAGKTYGAAFECLDVTFREPASHAIVAGPDYPRVRQSIFPTLEQLLGRSLNGLRPYGKFNEQKKEIRWWNGWVWHIASMDDPRSVEGLPECALAWLNEARLVRDFGGDDGAWANITRRLGGRDARPRHAILDTHSPTKAIMEELDMEAAVRYQAGGAEFQVLQGRDPGRRLYQWTTDAAVTWRTLDAEAARRIVARYKSESAKKRVLGGLYAVPAGVVLDGYDPVANLKEPPPGYRFEWFSGGIDWGWTDEHPAALVLWGHNGSRSWLLAESEPGVHWGLPRIKREAEKLLEKWGAPPETEWTGGHDKPEQAKALDGMGLPCDTYLGRVEDGVDLMNRRFEGAELMVHPDCKEWREDQESYVRDRDGKPDKDAYDPHFIDASRYGLLGARRPRYVETYEDGDAEDDGDYDGG